MAALNKLYILSVLPAFVSSLFLVPVTALAQDGVSLEEVVVTAQRREQSVQDVPISLEVISGGAILQQGYQDLTQVQSFTPGLNIVQDEPDQPSTKIRGVGTVGANFGFEQSVPLFIDGVNYGRGSEITSAFLDIQRVEVLRGPQPVYFGQNAEAGAISLTSRKPTPTWEGYLNAEYGNNNHQVVEAAAGGPVSDTVGVRVAGKYDATDGYLKSMWTGRKFPSRDNKLGRVIVQWTPTDSLQLSGKVEYLDMTRNGLGSAFLLTDAGTIDCGSRNGLGLCAAEDPAAFNVSPAYPIPTGNDFSDLGTGSGPPFWAVEPSFNIGRTASRHRWALNILPLMQDPPADLDLRRSDLEWGAQEHIKDLATTINIEYQFANGITFNSQSAYVGHDRTARDNQPGDNGPFPLRKTDKWEDISQWSQELRLTSPTGGRFEWMAGLYWLRQDMDLNQISVRAIIRKVAPYEEGFSFQDSTWKSAFASFTYNVTDQVSLDLGGRYTDVHKHAGITPYIAEWICAGGVLCTSDPDAFKGTVPLTMETPHVKFPPFAQVFNTSDFNWQAVLRWRPTDNISTYAKYANSFKAGGFDFGKTKFGLDIIDTFKFKDEHADNYEVGAKGTFWEGRGNAELTLFWSTFKDMQLSLFDPEAQVQRALNAAKQRSRGIEFRGSALVSDRWRVNLSAMLLDSKLLKFPGATCTQENIDKNECLDENGDPDPRGTIDRSGERAPHAPKWQFVIGTDYWFPVLDRYKLDLNGQLSFVDKYYGNDFSKIVMMDSHADVNLSVGFGPQDDTWTVSVYGRHLTEPLPSYHAKYDTAADGYALARVTESMYASYGVRFHYNFQ